MPLISIRKYAKQKGVDESAVRNAIVSGKIKDALVWDDNGNKKVDSEKADIEWSKNFDAVKSKSPALVNEFIIQPAQEENKITKTPIIQPDIEDYGGEDIPVYDENLYPEEDEIIVPEYDVYSEALRKKMILDARMVAVKLKEAKGELVSKKEIDKELATLGVEFRIQIEAMPDRILDEMLSANSRHDAYNIFIKEIRSTLRRLVEKQFSDEE